MVEDYPDVANLVHLGTSFEGRDVNALSITLQNSAVPSDSKPIIVVDAGQRSK